ncbi:hypothetical protein JGC47_08510 [Erwinia amylovora]|uniref:Uncharacterized protein n=1 Tax=Erwinia amylovora TaxID=552 RepID=A0ABX7MLL4_ERWAM|nr:hypothetical protein JGC47_08510 [Erwinia amylovora]
MFNFFLYPQGIFHSTLMMGALFSAAITTTSTAAPQSDMLAENRSGQQQKLSATPEDDALMTVLSPPVKKGPEARSVLTPRICSNAVLMTLVPSCAISR